MPEAFHDVLFPVDIALGSRGGPVRRTEVVTLASGHERRFSRWSHSRRRYEAGYGVRGTEDIEAVIAFFEARQGRRYAFRFRDPFDHETPADQVIGTGDGTETVFQLIKSYESGAGGHARPLTLPGSATVALDGTVLDEGTDFTLDTLAGQVTFLTAPALGVVVTAGCLFDVPVRFDTDYLAIEARPGGGDIPDIPLVEVRL